MRNPRPFPYFEGPKVTKALITSTAAANACGCIGPQNGQPLCPCRMRNVKVVDGRYVTPAQDLGPVPPDHDWLRVDIVGSWWR